MLESKSQILLKSIDFRLLELCKVIIRMKKREVMRMHITGRPNTIHITKNFKGF